MQSPSAHQLRIFDACGRHRSFKRAAEELCITPSAVSHQIKNLEQLLQRQLFVRGNRDVDFTAVGREYWSIVNGAFETIKSETNRIFAGSEAPLNILCARSFLRHWLLPRLSEFFDLHPKIQLQFPTFDTSDDSELSPSAAAASIRLGNGQWRGLRSDRLMELDLFPVCSPKYLAAHGRIDKPEYLLSRTLIKTTGRPHDWAAWFRAAGLGERELHSAISLEGETLEYQAALSGIGVALGREEFCEMDLSEGRLVRLFDISARAEGAYYFTYQPALASDPRLIAFRTWLLSRRRSS